MVDGLNHSLPSRILVPYQTFRFSKRAIPLSEVLDASAVRESPSSPAPEGQNHPLPDAITHNDLIRAHGIAAFTMLLLAVTFGIVASLQFFLPELTSEIASWGRLRFAHTQGIMLGWLGNAFIAFLYLAVPV